MPNVVRYQSKAYRVFEGDNLKMKFVRMDLGTYATGGVTLDPEEVGMETVYTVLFQIPYTTNIKNVVYDPSTRKILAYSTLGGTEVTNGTNLSGQWINAVVIGV